MKNILIVGATNIDIIAKSSSQIKLYDKNPGNTYFSFGGVARNICENIARLDIPVSFATIIGDDEVGKSAIRFLNNLGVAVQHKVSSYPTSTFVSVLNSDFDNYISISSMDIYKDLNSSYLSSIDYTNYDLIVSDANSSEVAKFLAKQNKKLFIDATSDAKAKNISSIISSIDYLKCTRTEMLELFNTSDISSVVNNYPNLTLIVTDKDSPVQYNVGNEVNSKSCKKVNVVNSIGAGDSFSAGIIYGLYNNYTIDKCVEVALKVSAHSVEQKETVSPLLNKKMIGEI